MVGDRLDYDVRPAKRVGMRAIWMLRGEAPDEPTPEQLAEADGAVRSSTSSRRAGTGVVTERQHILVVGAGFSGLCRDGARDAVREATA